MNAAVLPLLALTILVLYLVVSSRWLGKKKNRALHSLTERPDDSEEP